MRVEARALAKRFGEVAALREVAFSLPSGARTALVGPNGSGKTTLIRALLGLLRFEGAIELDGRTLLADPAIRQALAYVPQIAPQLSAPVAELVAAVGRLRGLERATLEKSAAAFELELAELGPQPFRALSGGTKQKLLLALAFASRPRLLVLDEPTASLDARSRERLFPRIEALGAGTSVILCSHRLEEIRQLVDHVLRLEDGRLVYDGPAAPFLAETTTALIDVRAEAEPAARWLEAHGFRRGASGWWLRAVAAEQKLACLRELQAALGEALLDLEVRDMELLEVAPRRSEP